MNPLNPPNLPNPLNPPSPPSPANPSYPPNPRFKDSLYHLRLDLISWSIEIQPFDKLYQYVICFSN